MIKIKLTTYNYSSDIKRDFLAQTPNNSGIWGDFQFLVNEPVTECDYWVVLDSVPTKESVRCPKDNIILITCEPSSIKKFSQKFINQFTKVITTQPKLKHPNLYRLPAGHGWWPKKSFDQLYGHNEVKKTKLISMIVSNKTYTPGHKKRLDFCLKLKEYFGDQIDIFGRGIQPFEDKWEVLAPYKYSVAIENSVEPDYISEKFTDCFVCLTFPFYYGCPNVENYYDKRAYQLIDIDDFEKTCINIEKLINDPTHYDRHLDKLIEAKNTYLTERLVVPLIANFIKKEYGNVADQIKTEVSLKPEREFQKIKYAIEDLKKFLIRVKSKIKI